jgi:hypothetical protein
MGQRGARTVELLVAELRDVTKFNQEELIALPPARPVASRQH